MIKLITNPVFKKGKLKVLLVVLYVSKEIDASLSSHIPEDCHFQKRSYIFNHNFTTRNIIKIIFITGTK
jgi:hypothetical protein